MKYIWIVTIGYVCPVPGSPIVQPGIVYWNGEGDLAAALEREAEGLPWEMYRSQLMLLAGLVRKLDSEEMIGDELLTFSNSIWRRDMIDGPAIATVRYGKWPLVITLQRERLI